LTRDRIVAPESADGAAIVFLTDAAAGSREGHAALPVAIQDELAGGMSRLAEAGYDDPSAAIVEGRYRWIGEVVGRVVRHEPAAAQRAAISDRIDRILTHRVWGLLIFAGIMATMFLSIFSWAEPVMHGIESAQHWLAAQVRGGLSAGPLRDLVADGLIGGVGSVVVFFPQICILFLFIGVLEDSGYMATAPVLMDKVIGQAALQGSI